jgi:aarF domain-containing kinase
MMSAFSVISPFFRRIGTVPSWTCRACLQSQKPPSAPHQFIKQQRHAFATRSNATTRPTNDPIGDTARLKGNSAPKGKSKRRRRLLVTGGALTIGAAVVTISDDAKHAKTAVERSYRVLGTLFLNVKEWVAIRQVSRTIVADMRTATATSSNETPSQTTPSS